MQLAASPHVLGSTLPLSSPLAETAPKSPAELARIVAQFAASPGWLHRVRLSTAERWYERLHAGPDHDIWVISWMPGQSTGFHDHAESAGAFVVSTGTLEEHRPGETPLTILPGEPRSFGPDYAHDVRNVSAAPAVSIHAYSPPLTGMTEYDLDGEALVPRDHPSGRVRSLDREPGSGIAPDPAVTIADLLALARGRLHRLSPESAFAELASGQALLVDIRPAAQRAAEGSLPGAVVLERNVLEWRLDPASEARLPVATGHGLRVIVVCSEGYTSSLAAASLQDLGLWRATDIVGGFQAWRAAGLPL